MQPVSIQTWIGMIFNGLLLQCSLTLINSPMKFRVFLILFVVSVLNVVQAQTSDSHKRYIKVPSGFLMVLRQGDDVFSQLTNLAKAENIPAANISGMGFVNAKFGFFNQKKKDYDPRDFENVEMASMNGTIAWQKGDVSLHVHGVVTDKNFQAFGGHMLGAIVSTGSVEILVTLHDAKLERVMEQPLGANVLNLDH